MLYAIEVSDLRKSYGAFEAVKGVSFSVTPKQIFAFLGPNGAGKSTTINMISTLVEPTSGTAKICGNTIGKDDNKIRSDIGTVFQHGTLDDLLTVRENLEIRGSLYGMDRTTLGERIDEVLRSLNASDIAERRYGILSGGQKRKADVARALIHKPKVLFLDEPTTGLDPQTRQLLWKVMRDLIDKDGLTIFLTTHYMEEAAGADYVVVMDKGVIVSQGTPDDLKDKYSRDRMRIAPADAVAFKDMLTGDGLEFSEINGIFTILLEHTREAVPLVERYQKQIQSFEVLKGSMDEAFIAIIGKGLE
ncbi:MAG: ATP-binding cassette domain-containing protein [Candidatus Methanoplasma sp.]|jgi:multidrug/hemolysin transport system ATP-binding protein|nr:ATP-binding cassette domain-containing protein [Candidatus Methanoplasma sp.]